MTAPIFANAPQIERLESVDVPTFRKQYVNPQRPVIFGGGFADWTALRGWTPENLRRDFPDLDVVDEHSLETLRLDALIDRISSGSPIWGRIYLVDRYPRMLRAISPVPRALHDSWLRAPLLPDSYNLKGHIEDPARPDLLVGGPDSFFPCYHYEHLLCHTFLFQIFGEKRVVLFEPGAKDALCPQPDYPNKSTLSPVEIPDPESNPEFGHAKFWTATLRPGDTLFSPCRWWIGLQNPSPSVTLRRHYVERNNWPLFCRELIATRRRNASPTKVLAASLTLKMLGVVNAMAARPGRASH